MSKIVSIILLATIASTLCHGGFLEVRSDNGMGDFPAVVKATEEFVAGFYSGLRLFDALPHQQDCVNNVTDPMIVQKVLEVVNQLKGINLHSDFIAVFRQVAEDVAMLFSKFEETKIACVAFEGDFKVVFDQLKTYITSAEYLQKVGQHAMLNIGGFTERGQQAAEAIKAQNYSEAGRLFGDIINFALFWNFIKI